MNDFDMRNRMRRDFRNEVIGRPTAKPPRPAKAPHPTLPSEAAAKLPVSNPTSKQASKKWKRVGLVVIGLVLLGAVVGLWFYKGRSNTHSAAVSTSPVPQSITTAVKIPVFYPDPNRLPKGYTLDQSSFSTPVKDGVAYSVSYGDNNKVVFSVQPKPSDNELQSFISNYIPLKIDLQTGVGQAAIGAYRSQTLVSLPVINGPWIVITAPPDIDQAQLKQVLNAIQAPK